MQDERPGSKAEATTGEAGAPAPNGGAIVRIERDQAGQLVVHVEGCDTPHVGAKVARCFPWSRPDCYVSFCDKAGKEISLLQTLDELPAESRRVVEAELYDKVFSPKIQRVLHCKHKFDITSITAETDRGEVTFQIRSRDDVHVLGAVRAIFRDVDGNTYEVADVSALDPPSRKHLQQYF